jgi:hypothetical protein
MNWMTLIIGFFVGIALMAWWIISTLNASRKRSAERHERRLREEQQPRAHSSTLNEQPDIPR